MGLTRREVLGGSAAALLAGGLAACGGSSTAGGIPCGVDALNVDSFQAATGTFAQYLRVYHPPTKPLPVSIDGVPSVRQYLQRGHDVVISFTPANGGPDPFNLHRFGQWCQSVGSAGYTRQIRATVYHEPVHKTPGGPEFIRQYTAFQQVAAQHGISFGVIHNTFPFAHGKEVLADWMPPAATWDYLGIDVYAGDDPRGIWHNPLSTIKPMTSWATRAGRDYSITEVGVDQKFYRTPGTAKAAAAWLGTFTGLGDSCRWLSYFDYGAWSIELNSGALIPAYKRLHSALTTR